MAEAPINVVAVEDKPQTLRLRSAKLQEASAGVINDTYAADLFRRLGFGAEKTQDGLSLTVPTYRGDINEEMDLIEEVLRFFGFGFAFGVAFALNSIHKQGLRYLFSPFPKSPDLAKETFVLIDASIPAAQRPTRVALFLERTDWGKEMGSLWESFAKQNNYQVVASGEYAPGAKRKQTPKHRGRPAGRPRHASSGNRLGQAAW